MQNCFVELKRWHNLLDDSINTSNNTSEGDILSESAKDEQASSSLEDGEILSLQMSSEETESMTGKNRIWSPIRIARFIKKVRAVGRGRVEEIQYKIIFGFNKDNGEIMCRGKHDCNVECAKEFIRNTNNDIMRMFNFRITEIERKVAQLELLQFFDKNQPTISTCVRNSSALGKCHEMNEECWGCFIDNKVDEILETFKMLKVNNEVGFPTENINWRVVGEDIDEVIFKITNDAAGEYPINWINLSRVLRTFLIFLLNTELTTIQYQLIDEEGIRNDEGMKGLLAGFEKGKLFHTLNNIQKIIMMRNSENPGKIEKAIMIKNRSKKIRPISSAEEFFLIKGTQYSSIMNSRESDLHGTIFYNEIQSERFIIMDPLLTRWTEKVEGDQIENMIEQLADMGVKVGRKMEVRWNTVEKGKRFEETEFGFSEEFWNDFESNYDGTFGGDINANGAKFRAEPFHPLQPTDNRKLLPICLN